MPFHYGLFFGEAVRNSISCTTEPFRGIVVEHFNVVEGAVVEKVLPRSEIRCI